MPRGRFKWQTLDLAKIRKESESAPEEETFEKEPTEKEPTKAEHAQEEPTDDNVQSEFPSLGGGAQPQQQINSSSPSGSYPWTSTSNVRPRSPERQYARGFGRVVRVVRARFNSLCC